MNEKGKCFWLNSEFKLEVVKKKEVEVVLVTCGYVINYFKLSVLKQPVYFAHDFYMSWIQEGFVSDPWGISWGGKHWMIYF